MATAQIHIPVRIHLTEQTAREIVAACDVAREKGWPCDVRVKSEYSDVVFIVIPEYKPHTQESLGFRGTRVDEDG